MDKFYNYYRSSCLDALESYGFRFKRNNCYRVIGDVFQSFYLNCSKYGFRCTVEFGVVPLCSGITRESLPYLNGMLDLGRASKGYPFFEYFEKTDSSMQSCIEEIIRCVNSTLKPFFERAVDCRSAYAETIRVKRIYLPEAESDILTDYNEYCMLLKIGDYERALMYLEAMEKQLLINYTTLLDNRTKPDLEAQYVNKINTGLQIVQERIVNLSSYNLEYINNFVAANERKSRTSLGLPPDPPDIPTQ